MRQEPARILGDQTVVLAHTNPRGLIADDPGSHQGETLAKLRQRRKFLKDERRIGVGAVLFYGQTFSSLQLDVGAFPGEERFAYPAFGHGLVDVWVKMCRQQVWMPLVELPQ